MTKVLISTQQTQGERPGDFSFVPEGELVARYGIVCAAERPDGLGGCGCGRAFAGLRTHQATTTAVVADLDMTEAEWRAEMLATLEATGWAPMISDPAELAAWIDDIVKHDLRGIAELPVGTVVGRLAYNVGEATSDGLVLRRCV